MTQTSRTAPAFTDIEIDGANIRATFEGERVAVGVLGGTTRTGIDHETYAKNRRYKAALSEYTRLLAEAPAMYALIKGISESIEANTPTWGKPNANPLATEMRALLARIDGVDQEGGA